MSFSARDMREYIPELRRVAKLAELDGDEWDLDEVPPNSLELAAMCNPRRVLALLDLLESYRDRVSVQASDVQVAGLTWAHVDAWVLSQPDGTGALAVDGRPLDSWRMKRRNPDGPTWKFGAGMLIHRGMALPRVVHALARLTRRSPFDILDAMAALPTKDQT